MGHIYDEHETLGVLRCVVGRKGGDHIYEGVPEGGYSCQYWDRKRDRPSCLVGYVLDQLSFPAPPGYVEGWSIATVLDREASDQASAYWAERFSGRALELMAIAQTAQDKARTWAEALEGAEKRYRQWYPAPIGAMGSGE